MLYRPRLTNGKLVPMSWPMVVYRLTNIICWPLEDNVSWFAYGLDRFCWIFGFLIFIATNDAEFRYIRLNVDNLDAMLTGIPTYFVLIEINIRAFTLGLKKEKFKQLLQKFYAEIYIEKSTNTKVYNIIQRQCRSIQFLSAFYLCSLITIMVTPVYLLSSGTRELLYKMTPLFDHRPLHIYLPVVLANVWVGFVVATMMFGEATILSQLIFHLNGRYAIMREHLNEEVDKLLQYESRANIVQKFRQLLLATIDENIKLNSFAQEIQREFSFRIFIIFSFIAASLCALGFKVYTSPMTSIGYIFWTMGKIQETIAYGQMGSTIITTTDGLSSMYYEAKWEAIIERSLDTRANAHLLKLINMAIMTNKKPFSLTGLNFFHVSVTTAVTLFQGAGSYFTCLISFR